MKGFRGPTRTLRTIVAVFLATAFSLVNIAEAQNAGGATRFGGMNERPLDGLYGRTPVTSQNQAPVIGGKPATAVAVGSEYGFTPVSSDPDADALVFSVTNLPSWARFDSSTGTISGIPAEGDVGVYSYISINVSDGMASHSLAPFTIQVDPASIGSVALSWTPPTHNEDGSVLVDLAGYKLFYGRSSQALNQSVTLYNPGITAYVVENLSIGTWFFVARAFNASGMESDDSPIISRIAY